MVNSEGFQVSRDEILDRAYRLAYDCQSKDRNCAQCMIAVLQEVLPFVARDDNLFRAASGLDAGATGSGIQNCGAFTAAAMIIGSVCGRPRSETPPFAGSTKQSRRLIRQVHKRFKETYGSVLCKDCRAAAGQRNCPDVVANAARWTAEVLLREFAEYDAR
jgi:C_GCAxxG_C_C family probable redox protein